MNRSREMVVLAFVAGVVTGLILALWWRAAQIRRNSVEIQNRSIYTWTPGVLPDKDNP